MDLLAVERIDSLSLAEIETLVLAGGGNRCWWQGGVLARWLERGWKPPKELVGTSAGAAIAASCLTDGPRSALDVCVRLYSANQRLVEWTGLARLKLSFAHERIYPQWIEGFVNELTFKRLCLSTTRVHVALTRPARLLGLAGSVVVGTLAYLADKYVWQSIHPRLPRYFGLRQEFFALNDCATAGEAQRLLSAAAAPPLIRSRVIRGTPAIDGGYVDNAPVHPQTASEKARTLVLLTRHYPKLPLLFRWHERVYLQASRRVPVSTWDCTLRATVRDAFALGERDAEKVLRNGLLRII